MHKTVLQTTDPEIFAAIEREHNRQSTTIELIASENIVSQAVMAAQGSVMTNKYAEGYPHKRYYGGCEFVDQAEDLAIDRVKQLFGCRFANVQPHSGSQANQAVFAALMQPGDTFMGLRLDQGGHLTHGSPVNLSGKWFNATFYGVKEDTHEIDYDHLEAAALQHKPKIIVAGGSAYPRVIDFKKFREVADKIGAYLLVDMAHFAGLVAGGAHPNPFPYAHVVTSTTHKTLRGPRGGLILTNDEDIAKKVNSAVFPGLQGGPLMHVVAAKAVAFKEALSDDFKQYTAQVIKNAKVLSDTLQKNGIKIVTGGTDTHLMLLDLRSLGITGKAAEKALDRAGLTCNKNTVPFDTASPSVTSGIRLGSPAGTTRGFKEAEFEQIGTWIVSILQALAENPEGDSALEVDILRHVHRLCAEFPIYENNLGDVA